MLIPIGDEPNPPRYPRMTAALITVNVLVFALLTVPLAMQQADPADPGVTELVRALERAGRPLSQPLQIDRWELFVFRHGFRTGDPSLVSLFFSMFLHAGFAHLATNMLFLFIFGDNVEERLGARRFLGAYLAAGVAALAVHAVFSPASTLPTIGASGNISGVLGLYYIWFPANRVRVLVWLWWWLDVIVVPARWVLATFVLIDNLLPLLLAPSSSGIAYGAHLGGFIAGALMAAAWSAEDPEDAAAAAAGAA